MLIYCLNFIVLFFPHIFRLFVSFQFQNGSEESTEKEEDSTMELTEPKLEAEPDEPDPSMSIQVRAEGRYKSV